MNYENDLLIVDEIIYDPRLPNNIVIRIDNELYMVRQPNKKPIPKSEIRPYKSKTDKSWLRATHDWQYFMAGMIPRGGFNVSVKREITEDEFNALLAEYNINPNDDVSAEFTDTIGAIYGDYAKTITSKQIRVPNDKAIELEQKLQDMGIQAGNIAPGRVNVRWGGYRPGAGAKKVVPPDATRRTFLLNDAEHAQVKKFIESLRS